MLKKPVYIGIAGNVGKNLSFGPEQCILVHDDLDMPMGTVRVRLSGRTAGHRGVASVLEAFHTDACRRVEIGVGQPGIKLDRFSYVVTPFQPDSRATVDRALAAAEARTLGTLDLTMCPCLTGAREY